MVSIKDKLSFFKKIIEGRAEQTFSEKATKLQDHYAEQMDSLRAELSQTAKQQQHQAEYEAKRRAGERKARQRLAEQKALRDIEKSQFDELIAASREAILQDRHDDPDAYVGKVFAALAADTDKPIRSIEGPEYLAEVTAKHTPDASYTVKPIDGLILYSEDKRVRYDFTLDSMIAAALPKLAEVYRETMAADTAVKAPSTNGGTAKNADTADSAKGGQHDANNSH